MKHAPVLISMKGSVTHKIVVKGYPPISCNLTIVARGLIKEDGTLWVNADQPRPGFVPNPDNIVNVEIDQELIDNRLRVRNELRNDEPSMVALRPKAMMKLALKETYENVSKMMDCDAECGSIDYRVNKYQSSIRIEVMHND